MRVPAGATDVTTYFKLIDSTAGTPETGYTITDLDLTYVRDRATSSKADATALGSVNAAHAANQAIEVDSTNCPGLYRVDWPDAAFAAAVDKVQLVVNGSGLDPAVIEVEIGPTPANVVEVEGTDPTDTIRNAITGGAYALDTDANGRIRLVSGTGAGEIDLSLGLGYVKSYYSWSMGINVTVKTAEAGSNATQLIDTTYGFTNIKYQDAFVGYYLFMMSGDNLWRMRRVTAYDAATNTWTVSPAFPHVIGIGDVYQLIFPGRAAPVEDSAYETNYYEEIADAILNRDIDQGGNGGRTVEEALAFLRNRWTLVGTTLTVYDTDDVGVLWTGTVTKDAAADPVTASDPT